MQTPHRLLCAAALAFAAVTLSATAVPASGEVCRDAETAPGTISDDALRRALRCVVNQERARHGLRKLRPQRSLAVAARRHARDMVRRGYFAHERAGSTTASRLRDADWNGVAAGETLAWGCGGLGVPRAILDGWLESPPHREILLGRYRRVGIGLRVGAPYATDCPGAGTWVMIVGRN